MRKEEHSLIVIAVVIVVFGFLYFSLRMEYQNRLASENVRTTRVVAVATDTPETSATVEGRKRTGILMEGEIERGSFSLTELSGLRTRVTVTGAQDGSTVPVRIHSGSCAKVGNATYSLNNLVSGRSETVLNVFFDTIVHAEKRSVLVVGAACADIK